MDQIRLTYFANHKLNSFDIGSLGVRHTIIFNLILSKLSINLILRLDLKIIFTGLCVGLTLRQGYNSAAKFAATPMASQIREVPLKGKFLFKFMYIDSQMYVHRLPNLCT